MTTKVATARLKIRILRDMDVVFSDTGMYIRFHIMVDCLYFRILLDLDSLVELRSRCRMLRCNLD